MAPPALGAGGSLVCTPMLARPRGLVLRGEATLSRPAGGAGGVWGFRLRPAPRSCLGSGDRPSPEPLNTFLLKPGRTDVGVPTRTPTAPASSVPPGQAIPVRAGRVTGHPGRGCARWPPGLAVPPQRRERRGATAEHASLSWSCPRPVPCPRPTGRGWPALTCTLGARCLRPGQSSRSPERPPGLGRPRLQLG